MKTPIDHYIPRPLRESREHKTADHIQQELDLMRAMYSQRRSLNQPRGDRMVGFALLTTIFVGPFLAAFIYYVIKH